MNERGFTLLELIIAISVSTMLMLIVGAFVLDTIHSANQDYDQTVAQANTQSAVTVLARVIRGAQSPESVNSISDPNQPGDWSSAPGTNQPIILSLPALDSSGNPIYTDSQHSDYFTNEVVIYSDGTTLYKRTLANGSAPGNTSKTTCPPSLATSSCPADSILIENVANLQTTYLDATGSAVGVPDDARQIAFTVKESATIGTRTYATSFGTTVTLRNY